MILNTIWQVPEDLKLSDLTERTIRVDSSFGDGLAWGLLEDFDKDYKEIDILRVSNEDGTLIISMTDLPFLIEVWNTFDDVWLQLNWTGKEWLVTEMDEEFESDQHTELLTRDVEKLAWSVCQKLGLTHLTVSQICDRDVMIELINRNLFSKLSLVQGNYFYRDLNSDEFKYERDLANLPPIDEIDVLHYMGDSSKGKDDFIYIFYDDDLPVEIVLASLMTKKEPLTLEIIKSDSTDIIDCINLVKDDIEFTEEEKLSNFYVVETEEDNNKKYRLFFNMSSFYPTEAPYLI